MRHPRDGKIPFEREGKSYLEYCAIQVQFHLTPRSMLELRCFRPEKDHPAQLRAFAQLLADQPTYSSVKLVLLGGARNADDRARVQSLKDLAEELKITPHVEFIINASYPDMLRWLSKASIGLSTMVDEHFGINVVEFMVRIRFPIHLFAKRDETRPQA